MSNGACTSTGMWDSLGWHARPDRPHADAPAFMHRRDVQLHLVCMFSTLRIPKYREQYNVCRIVS